ncbi:hypothetical protein D3C86_1419200 [compost metagenome]
MGQRGQADHRRGVSGEDETVGAEVAAAGGACRADTDPDRQRTEEQLSVLRKQGDQRDHHRRTGQGAEKTIEALGEHLAALRLHDNEHGDHRRTRLRQLQAHGQPQRQECREQHLEDVDPGHAVAACPVEETPAPFQGVQPAQGCGQGSHEILLNKNKVRLRTCGFVFNAKGSGFSALESVRRSARQYRHRDHRPTPSPVRHGH